MKTFSGQHWNGSCYPGQSGEPAEGVGDPVTGLLPVQLLQHDLLQKPLGGAHLVAVQRSDSQVFGSVLTHQGNESGNADRKFFQKS